MKKYYLLTAIAVLFHYSFIAQANTFIESGHVTIATLTVDYETYFFEGGNISYYSCLECPSDSLPFIIDYKAPGDFGSVSVKLIPTSDTILHATMVWMGAGEIYYPSEFILDHPFGITCSRVDMPLDIKYLDENIHHNDLGSDFKERVNLAWEAIDSLAITKLFAENGFKAGVLFYAPSHGLLDYSVAKWIFFLYSHRIISHVFSPAPIPSTVSVFPNPSWNQISIQAEGIENQSASYRLVNSLGVVQAEGCITKPIETIDISTFTSGLYVLILSDINGQHIATRKLLKE